MQLRRSALAHLLARSAAHPLAQERPAGAGDERRWIETFVPRLETPAAQLAHARRLKRNLEGAEPEERAFWRKLSVEAYQAVRLFHGDAAAAAEASFRAGELLRAGGDDERALVEFQNAEMLGAGTDFRSRARLEIGHLHRKNARLREALDAYLRVTADAAGESFRRDDAWYWAGVVWRAEDQLDDARNAWRRVAEHGVDPLDRILAFDAIGLLAPKFYEKWFGENPYATEEIEESPVVELTMIPFGPYLAAGALVALLANDLLMGLWTSYVESMGLG